MSGQVGEMCVHELLGGGSIVSGLVQNAAVPVNVARVVWATMG